jgi:hypothetical protein
MDATAVTSMSLHPAPKTSHFPAKQRHFTSETSPPGRQNDIHVGVCGGFVGVLSLKTSTSQAKIGPNTPQHHLSRPKNSLPTALIQPPFLASFLLLTSYFLLLTSYFLHPSSLILHKWGKCGGASLNTRQSERARPAPNRLHLSSHPHASEPMLRFAGALFRGT